LTVPERAVARGLPPRVIEVLACVSAESGVSVAAILGPSRARAVFMARALAMHVCGRETGAGPAQIGRWFGRDKSTVRNALDAVRIELARFCFSDAASLSAALQEIKRGAQDG
jgi:chromosomal replication initiation ATPase DnaA